MRINGLSDLNDKYSSYIIDIWGVLHDGKKAYEGVLETLETLKNTKKIFLSNAPRPNHIIHKRLQEIGIEVSQNEILTSGDFFLHKISEGLFENKKIFVMGEVSNPDLMKGVDINRTPSLEDADCVLMLMFAEHIEDVHESYDELKKALGLNLEFYCPNPDKIVKHGDSVRYTGGYFAKIYEEFGGKVHYFGKPYKPIYDYAIKKFGLVNPLCIGDALETDVKGAINSGLDSLMLQCGIHERETDVEKLFKQYSIRPTYIAKSFRK